MDHKIQCDSIDNRMIYALFFLHLNDMFVNNLSHVRYINKMRAYKTKHFTQLQNVYRLKCMLRLYGFRRFQELQKNLFKQIVVHTCDAIFSSSLFTLANHSGSGLTRSFL